VGAAGQPWKRKNTSRICVLKALAGLDYDGPPAFPAGGQQEEKNYDKNHRDIPDILQSAIPNLQSKIPIFPLTAIFTSVILFALLSFRNGFPFELSARLVISRPGTYKNRAQPTVG